MEDFKSKLDDHAAVFMITNPNTLGLFDPQVGEIARRLHERGAILYLDGANMNAILGIVRPGDMGVDLMHYNPHKTFSGPHGGGGPGAGPIAVRAPLAPFLPAPLSLKTTTERTDLITIGPSRSVACGATSATSAFCSGPIVISAAKGRTVSETSPDMRF